MNTDRDKSNDDTDYLDDVTVGLVCIHGIGHAGTEKGHLPRRVANVLAKGVNETGGVFHELSSGSGPSAEHDDGPTVRARISYPDFTSVVELFDGSWNRLTSPPGFLQVMWWAARVIPLVPLILASGWLSDRISDPHVGKEDQPSMGVMMGTILVFVVGLLAMPVMLAVFIGWVLAAGPFPACRDKLLHIVVGVLGDAYLYRSGALDTGILGALEELTRKVRSRTQCTVLVGHSQGAEISRRIALATKVDGCVFVGSGESPLSTLRVLNASPLLAGVMLLMLLPYPYVFVLAFEAIWQSFGAFVNFMWEHILAFATRVFGSLGADTVPSSDAFDALMSNVWQETGAIALVAVWMIVTALTVRAASKRPDDLKAVPDAEMMYVKSPVDPVAFGSMSEASARRYVPVASSPNLLKNLGLEHVAYFSKWQTGAFILEALFGSESLDLTKYGRPRPFPAWAWAVAALAATGLIALLYWIGTIEGELASAMIGLFTGSS